jgi:hypothetical protein
MKINPNVIQTIHVDSIGFDYFVKKIEFVKTPNLSGVNFITSHTVRARKIVTPLLSADLPHCFRKLARIGNGFVFWSDDILRVCLLLGES